MKVLLKAYNKILLLLLAFLVLVTSATAAKLLFDTGPEVASLGEYAHLWCSLCLCF